MEQASALWTYIIGVAWNSHRSGVPYAAGRIKNLKRLLFVNRKAQVIDIK